VVASGAADVLDVPVARHFRPDEAWGTPQDRVAPWLTRLSPVRMFALVATTSVAVAAWRRSWRPLAFGIIPPLVGSALTLVVKWTLARRDPLGGLSPDGGSYPSGHMVAVVVSVATCLLLVTPRVRWWWWAVAVGPCVVMVTSLVVTTTHWVTDVVGGCLLAGAVVAGSSRLRLRRPPPVEQSAVPEWEAGRRATDDWHG
jgi:membrane-associated phospholipid phosphatase